MGGGHKRGEDERRTRGRERKERLVSSSTERALLIVFHQSQGPERVMRGGRDGERGRKRWREREEQVEKLARENSNPKTLRRTHLPRIPRGQTSWSSMTVS